MKLQILIIFFLGLCFSSSSLSQKLDDYFFSFELRDRLEMATDKVQIDSLLLQSTFIHNDSLTDFFYDSLYGEYNAFFDTIPLDLNIDELKKYLIQYITNHQIIFINDTYPDDFSIKLLQFILPEIQEFGYKFGVNGLDVESINHQTEFIFKDSLGQRFRNTEFLKLIRSIHQKNDVFSFSNALIGGNFEDGIQFIQSHPEDKIIVLTDFQIEYSKEQNCFVSNKINEIKSRIPTAHFIDLRLTSNSTYKANSKVVAIVNLDNALNAQIDNINDVMIVDKCDKSLGLEDDLKTGDFEIPKNRIIEYPVILIKFRKEDDEKKGLPIEVREVLSKDDNTIFKLEKGKYTFLFLYTTRDMFHTLNVIKTK